MEQNPFGLGAFESPIDERDHKDDEISFAFPFPTVYATQHPVKVKHQKKIGACTGSLVYYIEYLYWKKTGVYTELSMAFLYKITKKYIDKNEYEGSALRSALKAAQKYGVCTEKTFPSNFDQTHGQLLDQEIPSKAMEEALLWKIGEYGSIPIEPNLISAAIYKYGMLYGRVNIDYHWWLPSWLSKDIDPLEKPSLHHSGHAIHLHGYDYSGDKMPTKLLNTWGLEWNNNGEGTLIYHDYIPHLTETWFVTLDPIIPSTPDNSPTVLDATWRALVLILKRFGAYAKAFTSIE